MTSPLRPTRRQSGSALIVSLIMLTLLTLFVLSAINSGTVNLRIAANTQARDEARAAAQKAIEALVSSKTNFYPTATGWSGNVSVNNDSGGTGNYSVVVSTPQCMRAAKQTTNFKSVECQNGAKAGVYCWDALWEVKAVATNSSTGVSQTVTQGVSITVSPTDVATSTCI